MEHYAKYFVNTWKLRGQLDATDWFLYCKTYCSLNMFWAPLCPSSGAQELFRWLLPVALGAVKMENVVYKLGVLISYEYYVSCVIWVCLERVGCRGDSVWVPYSCLRGLSRVINSIQAPQTKERANPLRAILHPIPPLSRQTNSRKMPQRAEPSFLTGHRHYITLYEYIVLGSTRTYETMSISTGFMECK